MKYLLYVLALIVASLYFFPVQFRFMPSVNSKMALAGLGLVILVFQLALNRKGLINKDIFLVSLFAAFVSLAGLFSVVYNGTPDYAYATYIVCINVGLVECSLRCCIFNKVGAWNGFCIFSVQLFDSA